MGKSEENSQVENGSWMGRGGEKRKVLLLLLLRKVRCASEVKDIVSYRWVCCDDFKDGSLHFFNFIMIMCSIKLKRFINSIF